MPACGLTMLDKHKAIPMKDYLRRYATKPRVLLNIITKATEELSILHDMGMVHGHLTINRIYLAEFKEVGIW